MTSVIATKCPEITRLVEQVAEMTVENNTEAVALGMPRLEQNARADSLFGAHPGSVRVREGVDLTAPIFDEAMDDAVGGGADLQAASV